MAAHPPPSRAAFTDDRLNQLTGEWRRAAARLRALDAGGGLDPCEEIALAYEECADAVDAALVAALDLDEAGEGCPAGPGHLAAARWHLTVLDFEARRAGRTRAG